MGVTLALTDNSDRGLPEEAFPGERTCCSVDDVADARSVAFRLGMPFYVFNFKEAFRREVMDRFAAAYQRGETPNPCIDCNRYIKFAKLMHRGEEIGFPYVATGHYARVEQDGATGRWLLKKGLDENKDQSYMLYSLTQWELSRLLLPLGGLTKEETRRLAEEHGFGTARTSALCPTGTTPPSSAGGREGTSLPGTLWALGERSTASTRASSTTPWASARAWGFPSPSPCSSRGWTWKTTRWCSLRPRSCSARDVNLISVESIPEPLRVKARVRYRQKEQPATVVQTGPDELRVVFDQPQRAITPGQALVLYDGDTVVGGGRIVRN